MADELDGSHLILSGTPKTVAIDAVRPHPENYRNGDITGLGESIEVNKLYKRLIVQKSTGYILAGTHTWLAAQQKGLKGLRQVVCRIGFFANIACIRRSIGGYRPNFG